VAGHWWGVVEGFNEGGHLGQTCMFLDSPALDERPPSISCGAVRHVPFSMQCGGHAAEGMESMPCLKVLCGGIGCWSAWGAWILCLGLDVLPVPNIEITIGASPAPVMCIGTSPGERGLVRGSVEGLACRL
jgi:hypothetical protein